MKKISRFEYAINSEIKSRGGPDLNKGLTQRTKAEELARRRENIDSQVRRIKTK